jgi:arylsulfatase A-like enzyme
MAAGCQFNPSAWSSTFGKPNIVLIYADDLGYGDISCNGAVRVDTPHIDRIAREGINLRNAHSSAATCTPSRYSMLTGEYNWRKSGTAVLTGDAALIIDPARETLASMLKRQGYRSGVVGKWHLGLGGGKINWNTAIAPGPKEVGFDYSFIIPATGDRVPTVYLENQRVSKLNPDDPLEVRYEARQIGFGEPTAVSHPELLTLHPIKGHTYHNGTIVNGISRIGFMEGGETARWNDEEIADTLTQKALDFIKVSSDEPFFLFFSLHDPHTPRVPHPRFRGKTEMGVRGDVIVQIDWCVGEILRILDERGLRENTLVIFSSDNGPVVTDAYDDGSAELLGSHQIAGPYSGTKYSILEGGTRIPLLMRWPAEIESGQVSHSLVSQVDFLASLAALLEVKIPDGHAMDSINVLPAFLGRSEKARRSVVKHAKHRFALLTEDGWKYVHNKHNNTETLYYLPEDRQEKSNLRDQNPERFATMRMELNAIVTKQKPDIKHE